MSRPLSTTRVRYPSLALPAPPRFTIEVPDGWIAHGASSVLAMVRQAHPSGPVNPNMTINADLVPTDVDAADILRAVVGGMVRSTAGAELVRPVETVESDPLRSAMAAVRIMGDGSPVLQVLTLFVVDAGLPNDVTYAFTIACTWPEDDASARETLHQIQSSFELDSADSGSFEAR